MDRIDIDAVEDALDLRYIETQGSEDRFYCHDAFGLHKHGDTTGKLHIHREKKVWMCWVCNGGNLVSLVSLILDLDPQSAVEWLYQFALEDQDHESFMREIDAILYPPEGKAETWPWFNPNVLHRWSTSHVWFDDRHIADFLIEKYLLRYDPSHVRYPPKQHGEPYEGPAIILPHFWHGRLVGWQSRWLGSDRPKWVPKYTATPGLPTTTTLWNWDNCEHQPIVVESIPTALFLLSQGHEAIATFGAGVHQEHVRLLRVFQEGVLLAPDHDKAGEKWFRGLSEALEPYIPVGAVLPPDSEGGDLGDLTPEELDQHLTEQHIWL